jgi:hypothetical protein
LTDGQMSWRIAQLGLLGALLVGVLLFNAEGARLLLHTRPGKKMLAGAAVLLGCGLGLLVLASAVLNRWAPAGEPNLKTRGVLLSCLLEAAWLPVFYLPAVSVLLVGPSALQIAQTLAR